MTIAEALPEGRIPEDTFGNRIALIRAEMGWNYRQAGAACGIDPESWRLWEKTGRHPQDYENVCRRIAEGSRYHRPWIAAGGPLRSRCTAVPADDGQMELALGITAPELAAV